MKVLQINSVCGVGSTGRIATDLYKVLEEQGHECVIAYGRGTAPEGIKTIKIGTDFDNYMHVAKTRFFDKHGFGSTKATKEFIKKVKEYDPDVIHLHNIHGYYINIEILFDYLKKSNKKVIWTLHDCWSFTGHCSHFDYIGCDKWKDKCEKCPQKKEYPSSILKDNSNWNYEKKKQLFTSVNNMTIVTPSKWLSNLVKESFLNKYPIKVINNGIDLGIFKPTKSNFREKHNLQDKIIILGVASVWTEKKGFNYFIELASRLDDSFKIIMLGITEKQKKMLPNNILGIKKTNNTIELAEIYSIADFFVNTTLEENFPTTNLEAIACGTKVISFDTGGCNETIDYGKLGICIKKGDINELESKILKVKEFNLELNNNINKKFMKKIGREFMIIKYKEVYEDIL
ncbi:glycosyltransferase [Clostridium perfringens]|uniref:glycosyltransferase n=1 Tax=Clostridium perfringens TaxID=1502 RepID=UPI001ABAE995|nr:glycosyltransferase [Clostridium perfringens]MBO3341638.1 glycosyltransferase [Clostridium perfringens]MDM0524871.1 glycosyltransferase [Clostridium perfringens]